jgi:hypothetical protein
MRSNFKFGMIAGAVALAMSAHAFANTSTGTAGTIFLSIDDATSNTNYVLDTGLQTQAFTGTGNQSFSINDANFASFVASVAGANLSTTTDNVTFSVIGGSSAGTPQTRYVDFTSTSPSAPNASSTSSLAQAYVQIGTFLGTLGNPSGGSSFVPISNAQGQWLQGGNSANFDNDLVITNGGLLSSALNFYQETETQPSSPDILSGVSTIAGTWSLNLATDTLNYTAIPTPLPAPLLLLLSGLGAMGIVGRRNRAAA